MGNRFAVHGKLLLSSWGTASRFMGKRLPVGFRTAVCVSWSAGVGPSLRANHRRRRWGRGVIRWCGAIAGDAAMTLAIGVMMPPLARSSALPKPVRGLATQPRATLWAKWATNWYALQERRSTLNAVQSRHGPRCGVPLERGALANPGRCPRLGCAAPTGRRRRHGRGQWRWEKIKPLASNAFLLSNLGQSYPKTGS